MPKRSSRESANPKSRPHPLLDKAPDYASVQQKLAVALDMPAQARQAPKQAEHPAVTADDAHLREGLLAKVTTRESPRPGRAALRFSLLPSSNVTSGVWSETVMIGGSPFALSDALR